MKKFSFKTGLLIYTGVLVVIMGIILLTLRGVLVKYEKAQGYNLVESFCKTLEADLTFNSLAKEADVIDTDVFSKYEDKNIIQKAYVTYYAGKNLKFSLSSKSYDVNNPVYIIYSGDDTLGELTLSLVSEKSALAGFLSVPTWKISKFKPNLSAIGNSYAISVYKDFKVTVNGVEVSESEIASKKNDVYLYLVSGLISEPEIKITKTDGKEVDFTITQGDDKNKNLYTVDSEYVLFGFTIPASFNVTSESSYTTASSGDLKTYMVVFDENPNSEILNEMFTITDTVGAVMKFADNENGSPVPQYYTYEISYPDTCVVTIGDKVIDIATISTSGVEGKQYSDVKTINTGYLYVVNPIETGAAASDETRFAIKGKNGGTVAFTLESGAVNVAKSDVLITVPDNFTVLINGSAPDVEAVKSEIKEYAELVTLKNTFTSLQYSVPESLSYTLPGQCGVVEVTITDNLGTETTYYVGEKLEILEQTGVDDMPEVLTGKVDPLAFGADYGRMNTKDLGTASQAYTKIRKYIFNNSYLDKSTKSFLNASDTYSTIGAHTTPVISDEKMSNFVMLADNVFYCDVYMISTFDNNKYVETNDSSAKTVRNKFNSRIYYVYADDDGDGVATWQVVAMKELVEN